ncbi:MAG: M3 family oligoendopeptidase, partial [Chitinophagales bacterium]
MVKSILDHYMHYSAAIKKTDRKFLPEDFVISDWDSLKPYFENLVVRKLDNLEELEKWLADMSELEAMISEDMSWRHIRMTCDTENKKLEEDFTYFMMEIQPKIRPYGDQLNRMLIDCPYTASLDQKKYFTYLRAVRNSIELFRVQNIPIQAELSVLSQQFGAISGKMTIEVKG